MENASILKQFTDSHLTGDWDTFEALCTEDFKLEGPAEEPMDKASFLTWLKSVYEANDNINNNVVVIESSENTLLCTVQMEGTHTRDWDLSFMELGVIPATNKAWRNPQETMAVTIRDGKIAELKVTVPDDGGIKGILSQLASSNAD